MTKSRAALGRVPWLHILGRARTILVRREAAIGIVVLAVLTAAAVVLKPSEKRAPQGETEVSDAGLAGGNSAPMGDQSHFVSRALEAPASTAADEGLPAGGGSQVQQEPERAPVEQKVWTGPADGAEINRRDGQTPAPPRGSITLSSYWLAEGKTQAEARKTAEARASFTKSLKLARVEHDRKAVALASTELGYLYQQTNALNDAESAFRQSLAIFDELGEVEGAARVSVALGMIHRSRGRYAEAEELYLKAVKLDEASSKPEELAGDYNGLGLVHLAKGRYDLAEQDHLKALEIHKKLRSDQGVAEGYANLGQVYYKRGELDRSADMFKKAIALEGAAGLKTGAGANYSNLGAVLLKKGDAAAACVYWKKAREILRKGKVKAQLERVEAMIKSEDCSQYDNGPSVVRELFSFLGDLAGSEPSSRDPGRR